MKMLSVNVDAKTSKGTKQGYLTGVLYLAPANVAGPNVCPDSTPGCRETCLFTAGRGVFRSVYKGRVAKTRALRADRGAFMRDVARDVAALARKANRDGHTPLVRLNGTSDLPWENIPATMVSGTPVHNVMTLFPGIQFYDYTKSARRMHAFLDGRMPRNYHLTFSRSECNDADALRVLARGGNVAVVFSTRRGEDLPRLWRGYRVVDGDVSDVRTADAVPGSYNPANGAASIGAAGVVIGLRAKGRARRDTSGFVVKV